ncbi:MAG: glycosyltransferase family 2 protein [Dialister sp.]|nr:glycosyltransferase family 2 protein [Dialister sp.]
MCGDGNLSNLKIGVVVLNYNDYAETIKCVNHILGFSSINYIVIVDNCSPNNSYKQLREYVNRTCNEKIHLISSHINGGYAKGNNIGIKYLLDNTESDIIGIVNPDISFENSLGESVKTYFSSKSDYVILTGLQTDKNGNISKRAFWRQLNLSQFIISMSPSLSKIQELICGKYVCQRIKEAGTLITVPTVEGCLFFARADFFKETGGFDEGTFLFMEEDILAYKAHQCHYKIGVIKNIKFVHDHSATIGKMISYFNRIKIMNRSKKYFFCRYLLHGSGFAGMLFRILEIASWCEQIVIMYPYLKVKTHIKQL